MKKDPDLKIPAPHQNCWLRACTVFHHIMLPELHLLLHATNRLMKELEKRDKTVFDVFLEKLGITRPKMHSGEFTGNMCKHILAHTSTLHFIIQSKELFHLIPLAEALEALNEVRISCFSAVLAADYDKKLNYFKECYHKLEIPFTSAVHIICTHIVQFIKLHKASLGKFSEQASESVHSDFTSMWQTCKIDKANSKYSDMLLNAVIRYNGRHFH